MYLNMHKYICTLACISTLACVCLYTVGVLLAVSGVYVQPKIEADPNSAKRNKRLFGFLSSHLNKAKQQLAKEQDTDFVSIPSACMVKTLTPRG